MSRFIREQYVKPLADILMEPSSFFASRQKEDVKSLTTALGIVIVSSAVSAVARTLVSVTLKPMMVCALFFVNNIGMVFISSGLGYLIAKMISRQPVRMIPFFTIYAFSFAATLLFAWIPNSLWITEPWKWWLIGTGLINGVGIEFRRTLMIILSSISVIMGFFWMALKII